MNTKPILLATDGSPIAGEARKEAFELAKALDAPLLVVTVWDVVYTPYAPIPPGTVVAYDDLKDEAEKVIADTLAAAEEFGIEVETILRRGNPADEIVEIADKYDVKMIVIGSHGWGTVRGLLFGSVSSAVLHDAMCPVLIARATDEELRDEEELELKRERLKVPA